MKISFSKKAEFDKESCLIIGVFEDGKLAPSHQSYNSDFVNHAISTMSFKGKKLEVLRLTAPSDAPYGQILLVGLGNAEKINAQLLQEIGAKIVATLQKKNIKKIYIDLDTDKICQAAKICAHIGAGALIRHWKFDQYKTKVKDACPLEEVILITPNLEESEKTFKSLEALSEGISLTRYVVSEPPNVLYPASMAAKALELEKLGIKVEVLNQAQMKELGMGALLGVAQGSIHEPKFIILQWLKGEKDHPPFAVVGKGVTFDSGGISLKPSNGMEDMKYDMAGSGVVLGLLKTLALRQAKVNVIGIMGMVENMPSGSAQRPSDVVKSMSGQTIEVINTDAEGRLVLADALWYTQDRFKPKAMVNLATLTGAIRVALGDEYAGLFSNNDDLAEKLTKAGQTVDEQLWRLPMGEAYDKDIDSDIADMKNTGSGRGAGSITAAQFLKRFVNDVPWAHLDIASVAWQKQDRPLTGKGATAFGVRLLNEFIKQNYE